MPRPPNSRDPNVRSKRQRRDGAGSSKWRSMMIKKRNPAGAGGARKSLSTLSSTTIHTQKINLKRVNSLVARARQHGDLSELEIGLLNVAASVAARAQYGAEPETQLHARSVFLMSSLAPVAYSIAVADALMFQHQVVIIETRAEQETAWLSHVKRHAKNAHLMFVTPDPLKYGHMGGSA